MFVAFIADRNRVGNGYEMFLKGALVTIFADNNIRINLCLQNFLLNLAHLMPMPLMVMIVTGLKS